MPIMPIKVACGCGKRWTVHNSLAGKLVHCPLCAEEVTAPSPSGISATAYEPSSLPHISTVEVVDLSEFDAAEVDGLLRDSSKAPGVRIKGEAAQRIAELWRHLPEGAVGASRCTVCGF